MIRRVVSTSDVDDSAGKMVCLISCGMLVCNALSVVKLPIVCQQICASRYVRPKGSCGIIEAALYDAYRGVTGT
jgi:hypothetical protein